MAEDYTARKHDTYAKHKEWRGNGGVGFAYTLGLIGAAVYYIQQAHSFGEGIIGFLKALVWPAFLVYDLLKSVHG